MMRAHHDLGGRPAGSIDRTERELEPWEKRVDAMFRLLSAPAHEILRVDELRRSIEWLGADEYDRLTYYERWITAISKLLLEKGVLTTDELGRKLEQVRARTEAPP
jgi:nitrile hydratase subunit beta